MVPEITGRRESLCLVDVSGDFSPPGWIVLGLEGLPPISSTKSGTGNKSALVDGKERSSPLAGGGISGKGITGVADGLGLLSGKLGNSMAPEDGGRSEGFGAGSVTGGLSAGPDGADLVISFDVAAAAGAGGGISVGSSLGTVESGNGISAAGGGIRLSFGFSAGFADGASTGFSKGLTVAAGLRSLAGNSAAAVGLGLETLADGGVGLASPGRLMGSSILLSTFGVTGLVSGGLLSGLAGLEASGPIGGETAFGFRGGSLGPDPTGGFS